MAAVTSILELSPRAEYLTRILYRAYLDKRESGISRSESFAIGGIDYICGNLAGDLSQTDAEEASDELHSSNLIFKNLWGYIALKNDFVDFCENNFIKV